jgi:hypothetical protein
VNGEKGLFRVLGGIKAVLVFGLIISRITMIWNKNDFQNLHNKYDNCCCIGYFGILYGSTIIKGIYEKMIMKKTLFTLTLVVSFFVLGRMI